MVATRIGGLVSDTKIRLTIAPQARNFAANKGRAP